MCAHFFNGILWPYTRGVHGQTAGCTFYEPVHPDGAQNKTLISNTACRTRPYHRSLSLNPRASEGQGGPQTPCQFGLWRRPCTLFLKFLDLPLRGHPSHTPIAKHLPMCNIQRSKFLDFSWFNILWHLFFGGRWYDACSRFMSVFKRVTIVSSIASMGWISVLR